MQTMVVADSDAFWSGRKARRPPCSASTARTESPVRHRAHNFTHLLCKQRRDGFSSVWAKQIIIIIHTSSSSLVNSCTKDYFVTILRAPICHRRDWSVVTAHNLTPVKRDDSNVSRVCLSHARSLRPAQSTVYQSWNKHVSTRCILSCDFWRTVLKVTCR